MRALVSLKKLLSNLLYAMNQPQKAQNQYQTNAIDLAIDLLLTRPANTSENEPITQCFLTGGTPPIGASVNFQGGVNNFPGGRESLRALT